MLDVAIRTYDVADVFDAAKGSKYFVGSYGADCSVVNKWVIGIGWHLHAYNTSSVPYSTMVGAAISPYSYCV